MDDYAIKMEIPVAWGDMDAFGHVNNTVYFKYFETLRIKYFQEIGYLDIMKREQIGPILADAFCRFRLPVKYPDTLLGGVRVYKMSNDRMWQKFALWSKSHNKLAAEGEGQIVSFDYKKGQKAPLQMEVVNKIKEIEVIAPDWV